MDIDTGGSLQVPLTTGEARNQERPSQSSLAWLWALATCSGEAQPSLYSLWCCSQRAREEAGTSRSAQRWRKINPCTWACDPPEMMPVSDGIDDRLIPSDEEARDERTTAPQVQEESYASHCDYVSGVIAPIVRLTGASMIALGAAYTLAKVYPWFAADSGCTLPHGFLGRPDCPEPPPVSFNETTFFNCLEQANATVPISPSMAAIKLRDTNILVQCIEESLSGVPSYLVSLFVNRFLAQGVAASEAMIAGASSLMPPLTLAEMDLNRLVSEFISQFRLTVGAPQSAIINRNNIFSFALLAYESMIYPVTHLGLGVALPTAAAFLYLWARDVWWDRPRYTIDPSWAQLMAFNATFKANLALWVMGVEGLLFIPRLNEALESVGCAPRNFMTVLNTNLDPNCPARGYLSVYAGAFGRDVWGPAFMAFTATSALLDLITIPGKYVGDRMGWSASIQGEYKDWVSRHWDEEGKSITRLASALDHVYYICQCFKYGLYRAGIAGLLAAAGLIIFRAAEGANIALANGSSCNRDIGTQFIVHNPTWCYLNPSLPMCPMNANHLPEAPLPANDRGIFSTAIPIEIDGKTILIPIKFNYDLSLLSHGLGCTIDDLLMAVLGAGMFGEAGMLYTVVAPLVLLAGVVSAVHGLWRSGVRKEPIDGLNEEIRAYLRYLGIQTNRLYEVGRGTLLVGIGLVLAFFSFPWARVLFKESGCPGIFGFFSENEHCTPDLFIRLCGIIGSSAWVGASMAAILAVGIVNSGIVEALRSVVMGYAVKLHDERRGEVATLRAALSTPGRDDARGQLRAALGGNPYEDSVVTHRGVGMFRLPNASGTELSPVRRQRGGASQ